MAHHLIFEGAELSGKSWIMSQIYNYLEPKYNQSGFVLDGCHWFNCDVGVYGTKYGGPVIKKYLEVFSELNDKNIIVEKFHISDIIYNRLHRKEEINYSLIEKELAAQNFKIILITFPENEKILQQRIDDRLKLYPHYKRIMHEPGWYIAQQREYLKEIKKTKLPHMIVPTENLPDINMVDKILEWIGEENKKL
jgi:thymidylate kinase